MGELLNSAQSPDILPAVLFRTRIRAETTYQWQKLEMLDITILERNNDGALILVDFDQLETLARLGFGPSGTDELTSLTAAQAAAKPWLASSLSPLMTQAAATQTQLASTATIERSDALTPLRTAVHALTPEQRAGIASLASVDDDADGLTNTEEAWWCTDPLNPNSDGDAQGYTDGQEIHALLDFTLPRSVRWGYGPPFGPPNAWPNFNNRNGNGVSVCNDGDYDTIPDFAEVYMVGTRVPEESTDKDKFDDGQELFGVTYCSEKPDATSCGYGNYPRIEYWNYIKASMPSWVRSPGDNPFVAAFPTPKVSVVPGSWNVERVTTITTSQAVITQTTQTYETSVTSGQNTGIANTATWNDWSEVSEAVETPMDTASGASSTIHSPDSPDKDWWKMAEGVVAMGVGGAVGLVSAGACGATVVLCPLSVTGAVLGGVIGGEGWDAVEEGWSDDPNTQQTPDQAQSSYAPNVYNQTQLTDVNVSVENNLEANTSIELNNNFDTQGIVNSMDGVAYAINQQGDLMARGFYDVSSGLADISRGMGDIANGLDNIYAGLGDISNNLEEISAGIGDISYQISRPRLTETRTNGRSVGGEQTTSHEEYEEHTVGNSQGFTSGESWSTAWAVDSSRAALFSFRFTVQNVGTDYIRELDGLVFNVYLGKDATPLVSYPAWQQFSDGKLLNIFPGVSQTFPAGPVPLTLAQMRRIDPGEKLRVVVAYFNYGADELFYQDAVQGGLTVLIEDGLDDGDESVDTYVMPTWGAESVQDVLLRYFPANTDAAGNLTSLWTPEFDGTNPPTWHEHYLSDIAWWSIYLSQQNGGNAPLQDLPTQQNSTILFRFSRDSDRDGYQDRVEVQYGTDKNDPASHPMPRLSAGYVVKHVSGSNEATVLLKLLNSGTFEAYNVQAVMYAPDDTTTIGNNTVGGNGRVLPGRQIAVGSRVLLEAQDLANWGTSTARPYAGGNYTGESDRTYSFSVTTPGSVGAGSTALAWSDGAGHSGTLDIGSAYRAPLPIPVSDGLQIGFNSGDIQAGAGFTVRALTPRDTFTYTIAAGHENDYTEPAIVVSYSDPRGSHRFATTVKLINLDEDLVPHADEMLGGVRLEIVATPFNASGNNTTHFVFNNPHPKTIAGGHLYMHIVGGGHIVKTVETTLDIPSGPSVHSVTWSPADFSPAYDPSVSYVIMGFWTDRYGNIIDTISRPLATLQDDNVMKAEVPVQEWNVGTVYRPESYDLVNSLLGASHTEGVVKQSTGYRLRGVAGQPSVSAAMTSTHYSLASGYWAAVRGQESLLLRAASAAQTAVPASASNDVSARFPANSFILGSTGTLPLILGVTGADSGVTITQAPHKALGSGAYTETGVQLNTDNLPIGPFEKAVTVYTNDPSQPEVRLRMTGNVVPSGEVAFVYDYRDEERPLNRIVHVNSVRYAGETIRFDHSIPGADSSLYPLYLYGNDDTGAPLGRGDAIGGQAVRQVTGDPSHSDLVLPEATASRRDYIVYYGYRADLPSDGTATYNVPLRAQNYQTVTLDIVVNGPLSPSATLLLDVGADGNAEWSFTGTFGGEMVHASDPRLAAAVSGYFAGHNGATTVPIRLTTNTGGTYFLANLRGTPSTNRDLRISGGVRVSNNTPTESDSVSVCATVINTGQGKVPAAVLTFFAHDPTANTNLLIGHRVLTGLAAAGGYAEGCVDWDTTGYLGGVTLYAYADFLNQIGESDENNNSATSGVTVRSRPDLSITAIALSDDEPVIGEVITVTANLHNAGQTAAAASVLALYDGNPDAGGTLISRSSLNVAPTTETTVSFAWTPGAAGAHKLFIRADQDHQVHESDESNNDKWRDIYIGFASPLLIDSGAGDAYDPVYTAALGFGYLDGETNTFCGTGADGTQRSDYDGKVQYRFDHLLPGHFYHLDLTLNECDGLGRQQQVRIDDNLISDVIDLSDLKSHRLSFRLDPAFYADRSVVVSVEELTGYDAIVSEINLYDIDYRYADAGASNEPAYTAARSYGWLDGLAQSTWGTLPYQTRRIDLGDSNLDDDPDNELRYRFDGLHPNKRYQLLITAYQGSGTATVRQTVAVDSVDTGVTLEVVGVDRDDKVVDVPPGMYTSDGTITVRITRLGATAGAFVNEIALEELTLLPEQATQVTQALTTHTGGPNWFSFDVKPPVRPAVACTGVTATSAFTSVYGDALLGGAAAPIGSIVEAYTPGGAKTGCFKVTADGLYGYMRVYGAEGATPGMLAGDPIIFKINGITASPTPYPVIWQDDKATCAVDLSAPDVIPVETLLAPIAGKYTRLQCETGTYLPPPADPRFNTCTTVTPGQNYLLWMNTAAGLSITGSRIAVDKPIDLHAGYNWLGYLPTCELSVVTALGGIAGKYDLLHSEAGTYKPPPANPAYNNFNTMAPGRGYMIHMTQAATLTYPANLCGTALNATEPAEVPAFTCPATPTSRFTQFYGHVTPVEDAPSGAVILAYSPRGEVVGCGQVQEGGIYPYLRVYGAEDAQPGMQPGETVRFKVNGQLTLPSVAALWQNDWDVHPLDLALDGVRYQYLPLIVR